MSGRIKEIRAGLRARLERLAAPGTGATSPTRSACSPTSASHLTRCAPPTCQTPHLLPPDHLMDLPPDHLGCPARSYHLVTWSVQCVWLQKEKSLYLLKSSRISK